MKEPKKIMVCVTKQKTCERLIMNGYNTLENGDKIHVIHVVNENDHFLHHGNDGEALEYLFGVSKKVGAELTVIRSKNVIKAIEEFAVKNNINHIIMGESPDGEELEDHRVAMKLKKKLPDVQFVIL